MAAATLQRMKEILGAAAPYGMIKDAASLIRTVEGVNTTLANKRRDHLLQRIDVHIGKVEVELDAAQASADLHNQCLYPLQTLKRQVEKQASIAHINQTEQSAVEAGDEAFDKIEAASKPKKTPDVGETEPPVYVKKRRVVQASRLAPKGFLETQSDVDDYLNRLRQALESAINNDERVEIR